MPPTDAASLCSAVLHSPDPLAPVLSLSPDESVLAVCRQGSMDFHSTRDLIESGSTLPLQSVRIVGVRQLRWRSGEPGEPPAYAALSASRDVLLGTVGSSKLPEPARGVPAGAATALDFSPDGVVLAVGLNDCVSFFALDGAGQAAEVKVSSREIEDNEVLAVESLVWTAPNAVLIGCTLTAGGSSFCRLPKVFYY
jgi:WD40 repeat protein